jgi:hypothetical protein
MFRRGDPIPTRYGAIKFPEQIKDLIQSKRYANAAELIMSRQDICFNMAFVFLSNCPEALAYYLLLNIPELEDAPPIDLDADEEEEPPKPVESTDAPKEGSEEAPDAATSPSEAPKEDAPLVDQSAADEARKAAESKRQEDEKAKRRANFTGRSCVFINLYLAIAIPMLTQRPTEKEKKPEREKLLDFCRTCKSAIDKNAVYQICRTISDDELVRSLYLLFGDIWQYSMLLLELQQYDKVVQFTISNQTISVTRTGRASIGRFTLPTRTFAVS